MLKPEQGCGLALKQSSNEQPTHLANYYYIERAFRQPSRPTLTAASKAESSGGGGGNSSSLSSPAGSASCTSAAAGGFCLIQV